MVGLCEDTKSFIPKRHSSLDSAPLRYSTMYCKYTGKVDCTSTSMCRTLNDKGMARDSVGWHCVDLWRHSGRLRERDAFTTPKSIAVESV
jgi:hypothetical protein